MNKLKLERIEGELKNKALKQLITENDKSSVIQQQSSTSDFIEHYNALHTLVKLGDDLANRETLKEYAGKARKSLNLTTRKVQKFFENQSIIIKTIEETIV